MTFDEIVHSRKMETIRCDYYEDLNLNKIIKFKNIIFFSILDNADKIRGLDRNNTLIIVGFNYKHSKELFNKLTELLNNEKISFKAIKNNLKIMLE